MDKNKNKNSGQQLCHHHHPPLPPRPKRNNTKKKTTTPLGRPRTTSAPPAAPTGRAKTNKRQTAARLFVSPARPAVRRHRRPPVAPPADQATRSTSGGRAADGGTGANDGVRRGGGCTTPAPRDRGGQQRWGRRGARTRCVWRWDATARGARIRFRAEPLQPEAAGRRERCRATWHPRRLPVHAHVIYLCTPFRSQSIGLTLVDQVSWA